MNSADQRKLEIALGHGEPLQWPNSLEEEIALAAREEALARGPNQRRSGKQVSRLENLLDELCGKDADL